MPVARKAVERTGFEAIPVTLVTGFLGSGKTSLLNHLLSSDHGLRIAVVVNEFGEISIDHRMIVGRAENLIELANGCVCCTAAGNLAKALGEIAQADLAIEYLVIETSGVADPFPVAEHLLRPGVRERFKLDGIVTIVDAYNFDANLEYAEAAYNQIINGDIIIINKIDLVSDEIPKLIENNLKKLNDGASVLHAINANVDPYLVIGVDAARLKERFERESTEIPAEIHRHTHEHSELHDFETFHYESTAAFSKARFQDFALSVPRNVFRAKGILHIADENSRYFFHVVGDRADIGEGPRWVPQEERKSDIVFIGCDLDRAALTRMLDRCVIGGRDDRPGSTAGKG